MKRIIVSLFVAAMLSSPTFAQPIPVEFHQVDTSVAVGSLYINGSHDHDAFAVGTLLSSELAQTIETNEGAIFGLLPSGPRLSQLVETFGTLDNLEFLTSDLTQFGNAGDQLYYQFTSLGQSLVASAGAGSYNVVSQYVGTGNYALYGGFNGSTVVVGNATVDFYDVTADITVPEIVPVPGAVLLGVLGLGAAGLKLRRIA